MNIVREGLQTRFDVQRRGTQAPLPVQLNLPGHAQRPQRARRDRGRDRAEVGDAAIQAALANFQGIDRRLQQYGDVQTAAGRVTLIDDYGHHPTELAATLEAIRQGWPQPAHRAGVPAASLHAHARPAR